jgi:hypothetical protein
VYSTTFGTLPALAAGAVTAVTTAAFSNSDDMVPGTTSKGTLTFGFTTATDLAVNARVMIQLPLGYLAAVTSAKLGANSITCTHREWTQGCGSAGIKSQLMTCTTANAVAKGVQSLVLQIGGFTVGPKNAGTSYSVWTSSDLGATIDTVGTGSVPAITAGGSASGSGTAAASVPADMVPGTTTTGTLTLSFKTETRLPMTNGRIIFSLTKGYLSTTATTASLSGGSTTSTCSISFVSGKSATGCSAAEADSLICTIGTADLSGGTYSLVLAQNTWSVGANQPAGTFSVSTTNNNVALDAASTIVGILPAIGGSVSVTSFTAATPADLRKIGVASTGTLSIGFTTSTKLPSSSTIVFTLPISNYLTILTTATMTGKSTTAPTCTLQSSNTVLRCVLNGVLDSGDSTITFAQGWVPGTTVSSASFPANSNFNKATYTISNIQTPARYLAAATYTSPYQATYGISPDDANYECSASISFSNAPVPPGTGAKAASGVSVVLSASAACAIAFVLL